jgi:hypothetical protein
VWDRCGRDRLSKPREVRNPVNCESASPEAGLDIDAREMSEASAFLEIQNLADVRAVFDGMNSGPRAMDMGTLHVGPNWGNAPLEHTTNLAASLVRW